MTTIRRRGRVVCALAFDGRVFAAPIDAGSVEATVVGSKAAGPEIAAPHQSYGMGQSAKMASTPVAWCQKFIEIHSLSSAPKINVTCQ